GSNERAATQLADNKSRATMNDSNLRPATANILVPQNDTTPAASKVAHTDLLASANESRNQSEQAGTDGGWYARKRDQVRPKTTLAARRDEPLDTSAEKLPDSVMVARPQPLGKPEQTILEWSRPPQSSTAPQTMLR
ncbi:MAG TPA: hypothetical protein VL096_10820, partial [Pirellulaceae bacterium]|nr:hypothetical protein [Pirellulaceae bacterium]